MLQVKLVKKEEKPLLKCGFNELLDTLSNREVTGHDAIALVNRFAENQHDPLIYKIIDKDLGIRAGAKVINKAVPGLVPDVLSRIGPRI